MTSTLKKKALIIDDEEGLRESLAFAFELEGFEVTMAADGVDAMEKLQNESFGIIITDLRMPRKDGLTLLQEIREKHATEPPVILVSGGAEFSEEDLQKMGAAAIFDKPVNTKEMFRFIQSLP